MDSEMQRELHIFREWYHTYGAVAAGAVDHHAEYLAYRPDIRYAETPPFHGTDEERRQRLQELKGIASGRLPWQDLFKIGSWESPIDVAALVAGGSDARVDILNVRNGNAISQLPPERIVEVSSGSQVGRGSRRCCLRFRNPSLRCCGKCPMSTSSWRKQRPKGMRSLHAKRSCWIPP
ncbi:hypothetical protein GZH47_31960 (plasmid) [Paenibacillus rhizovicinus]|uniref:Uncharacterized protein n=1 Tax=Paenibacillus rhizovicinus TaxID=2704463 RepID=A0A6C0PAF2_9BACL|nr:hypothetical protein GZH47_31960 [Paenibacillus rhizovicinus]